jgi:hypothetical protein
MTGTLPEKIIQGKGGVTEKRRQFLRLPGIEGGVIDGGILFGKQCIIPQPK